MENRGLLAPVRSPEARRAEEDAQAAGVIIDSSLLFLVGADGLSCRG